MIGMHRCNAEVPGGPLHRVCVWATIAPPKEELREWACLQNDFIVLHGGGVANGAKWLLICLYE